MRIPIITHINNRTRGREIPPYKQVPWIGKKSGYQHRGSLLAAIGPQTHWPCQQRQHAAELNATLEERIDPVPSLGCKKTITEASHLSENRNLHHPRYRRRGPDQVFVLISRTRYTPLPPETTKQQQKQTSEDLGCNEYPFIHHQVFESLRLRHPHKNQG